VVWFTIGKRTVTFCFLEPLSDVCHPAPAP
jgi:hypothetical protein